MTSRHEDTRPALRPAVQIDGSQGEGGGQILRTAMALGAITGTPLAIENIRAGRAKPGLMRQHLTAVRAAATICDGTLTGDELHSRALSFTPGQVRAGEYHFPISTAGSACLVLQTVLWPLLFAGGPSHVVIEGGTHNPMAPPFDFLAITLLPLLRRMGARVDVRLERHGFYPAGGGRIAVDITPGALAPIEIIDAGPVRAQRARALVVNLPGNIAGRELAVVREELGWPEEACRIQSVTDAPGAGNVLFLELEREGITEVVTSVGERGKPAARVAGEAIDEARRYLAADAPVGEHLADQLVIPMALAGGGAYRTGPLTLHSRTNIDVVRRFLPVEIAVEPAPGAGADASADDRCVIVRFSGAATRPAA
jgi:RNA 3'-terminal phosphate cyclase (ATP)